MASVNPADVAAARGNRGLDDLIAEVAALDVKNMDQAIDSIIEIDGVERTESSIILSTRLKR